VSCDLNYPEIVSYAKDPRVDAYLDPLPEWQQEICHRVRDLVHAADPAVEETIKRKVQPYFVLEGNICALLAAKDHVNVFLYDGAIVPDPENIITAGQAAGVRSRPPGMRPEERRRLEPRRETDSVADRQHRSQPAL
jgi:hypothetical protein